MHFIFIDVSSKVICLQVFNIYVTRISERENYEKLQNSVLLLLW